MKVACYCRISTKKDSQLDSLENQKEFFEDLVKQKGYEMYELYYDEGISGKSLNKRTGFNKMMKDASLKKFDAILVKDISRIMRNTKLFLDVYDKLMDYNINLFLTSYGMDIKTADKTYLTILASMAEDESRKLSVRIKFGKDITAKKGRVPNFVFGYDRIDNYTLAPNEESDTVRQMFDLYINQNYGTARIAGYLNENNVLTKKMKGKWTQKTVIDILRNRLYIGWVINKKSENVNFPNTKRVKLEKQEQTYNEAFKIIDEEIFYEAQAIMEERKDSFNLTKKRESYKYSFSNLIKCAHCGYSFRRCKKQYTHSGKLYKWWVCSYRNAHGTDSCINEIRVDEEVLETAILDFLNQIISNKKSFINRITKELENLIEENQPVDEELSRDEIQDCIKRLNMERIETLQMKIKRFIQTDEELYILLAPIDRDIAAMKLRLAKCGGVEGFIKKEDIARYVERYFTIMENIVNSNMLDNAVLKTIIDSIQVSEDGRVDIIFKMDEDGELTVNLPLEVYRVPLTNGEEEESISSDNYPLTNSHT